jgi:hypothetical protein
VLLIKGTDNQWDQTRPDGANRYPALLVAGGVVTLRNGAGIVENENCRLKANIMLAKILAILAFVPPAATKARNTGPPVETGTIRRQRLAGWRP